MSKVARALSRFADTMGRRGGYGQAMVEGADVNRRLAESEYNLDRQRELDEMQRPGMQLQQQRAKEQLEPTTLNLRDILGGGKGQTPFSVTAILQPRKDGTSLDAEMAKALTGKDDARWDPKTLDLVDGKGNKIVVPKWKRDERLMPGAAGFLAANLDPVHMLEDRKAAAEMAMANIEGQPPETMDQQHILGYQQQLQQADEMLNDPTKRIALYRKYANNMRQLKARAVAAGASEQYLGEFDKAMDRAEKKIAANQKLIPTPKEELELSLKRLQIANEIRQGNKLDLEYTKLLEGGGKGQLTAKDKSNLRKDAAKLAREAVKERTDPTTGQIMSEDGVPLNAKQAMALEKQMRDELYGYFVEGNVPEGYDGGGQLPPPGGTIDVNAVLPGGKGTSGGKETELDRIKGRQGGKKGEDSETGQKGKEAKPSAPPVTTVEELDAAARKLDPGMFGPYKKSQPWSGRAKTVGERVAGFTGQTQKGPAYNAIKKKGENALTFQIRRATGISDLYEQNNIAMKLKAVYPDLSEEQLAEMIKSGKLLSGEKKGKDKKQVQDKLAEVYPGEDMAGLNPEQLANG